MKAYMVYDDAEEQRCNVTIRFFFDKEKAFECFTQFAWSEVEFCACDELAETKLCDYSVEEMREYFKDLRTNHFEDYEKMIKEYSRKEFEYCLEKDGYGELLNAFVEEIEIEEDTEEET